MKRILLKDVRSPQTPNGKQAIRAMRKIHDQHPTFGVIRMVRMLQLKGYDITDFAVRKLFNEYGWRGTQRKAENDWRKKRAFVPSPINFELLDKQIKEICDDFPNNHSQPKVKAELLSRYNVNVSIRIISRRMKPMGLVHNYKTNPFSWVDHLKWTDEKKEEIRQFLQEVWSVDPMIGYCPLQKALKEKGYSISEKTIGKIAAEPAMREFRAREIQRRKVLSTVAQAILRPKQKYRAREDFYEGLGGRVVDAPLSYGG